MNLIIDINKVCGKNKVSRDDGKIIFDKIVEAWNIHPKITIDFGNILVASVSFLDEAFGKLALDNSRKELVEKLNFINILDFDKALLNDILKSRFRQNQMV